MKAVAPSQIISWFRNKAAELNRIADTLENTFNTVGQPNLSSYEQSSVLASIASHPRRHVPHTPSEGHASGPLTPNAANIRDLICLASKRVGDLSKYFECPDAVIHEVIKAHDSGLIITNRGWVRLSPKRKEPIYEKKKRKTASRP